MLGKFFASAAASARQGSDTSTPVTSARGKACASGTVLLPKPQPMSSTLRELSLAAHQVDEALVQLVAFGARVDRERARLVHQAGVGIAVQVAGVLVDVVRGVVLGHAQRRIELERRRRPAGARRRSPARARSAPPGPSARTSTSISARGARASRSRRRACCARRAARRPRPCAPAGLRARRAACAPRTPRAGAGKLHRPPGARVHDELVERVGLAAAEERERASQDFEARRPCRPSSTCCTSAVRSLGDARLERAFRDRAIERGDVDHAALFERVFEQGEAVAQDVHLGGEREHHADEAVDRRVGEERLLRLRVRRPDRCSSSSDPSW